MTDTELIEKLAVIMDRLDRIERKVDELSKNQNMQSVPLTTLTYPMPQIWYKDKGFDWNKVTCNDFDKITIEVVSQSKNL